MVPPGGSRPRRSASTIMASAVRSLIEPPGFIPSTFTQTSAIPGSTMRSSRTVGVPPMYRSMRDIRSPSRLLWMQKGPGPLGLRAGAVAVSYGLAPSACPDAAAHALRSGPADGETGDTAIGAAAGDGRHVHGDRVHGTRLDVRVADGWCQGM